MNVFWTPDAKLRLREIEAYIAKDSPNAAHETAIRLIVARLNWNSRRY